MENSENNYLNKSKSFKFGDILTPLRDSVFLLGSVFLVVALLLHYFAEIFTGENLNSGIGGAAFWLIYSMSIGYSLVLLTGQKMRVFWKKQPAEYQPHRFLLWTIGLIGCFVLNRDIPIFQESTTWLSAYLVLAGGSLYLYAWKGFMSVFFQKILFALLGISSVLFLYFSIYLISIYPIGILGILFLGISFHTFIPLILLVGLIVVFVNHWKVFKTQILIGFLMPMVVIIFFVTKWISVENTLQFARNDTFTASTDELPNWVLLAQKMKSNFVTERYLKTDIVYQTPKEHFDFFPERNFEEIRQHDPLVMIATFVSKKTQIPDNERIKLLELYYNARHNSEERLWSGRDLHTENVITQAKIYPEYRIAYTEKTINIRNSERWGWGQQEALYTFYVPEGSAVSSLSLWINGREEKASLTTQAKADSAYKTIVGVESRDPSVVHWQEGNRIVVRVFPCTPKENRTFKIGFTSPLKYANERLIYENIYFKGPESTNATESIKVEFSQNIEYLDVPWIMGEQSKQSVSSKGNYRPDWHLVFPAVSLSNQAFMFQNKSYRLTNLTTKLEPFTAQNIYLDLNESWSKSEFEKIYNSLTNNKLWIYDGEFKRITDENKEELFDALAANRFSLFPFHKIQNPTSALVVTKASEQSPILKDLEGSSFAESFKNNSKNKEAVRTFVLDNTISPYLKTLKELRVIQTYGGNFEELSTVLKQKKFPQNAENEQTVKIENAQMLIQQDSMQTKTTSAGVSDHLLRLFAYNHILQQIGRQYFDKNYITENLINEASTANIVTPISSLIVLEKQADYDRFDIQKNKDGLGNATLKKSGAVPEPHEWLLIVLFAGVVLYYLAKGNGRI